MKVLLLGGNGYLGPHVVKALDREHELLVTDIKPPAEKSRHEFRHVDVASWEHFGKQPRAWTRSSTCRSCGATGSWLST